MNQPVLDSKVAQRFVSVTEVLDFVDRTHQHGAPLHIAIKRASKRYGVEPGLVKSFVSWGQHASL